MIEGYSLFLTFRKITYDTYYHFTLSWAPDSAKSLVKHFISAVQMFPLKYIDLPLYLPKVLPVGWECDPSFVAPVELHLLCAGERPFVGTPWMTKAGMLPGQELVNFAFMDTLEVIYKAAPITPSGPFPDDFDPDDQEDGEMIPSPYGGAMWCPWGAGVDVVTVLVASWWEIPSSPWYNTYSVPSYEWIYAYCSGDYLQSIEDYLGNKVHFLISASPESATFRPDGSVQINYGRNLDYASPYSISHELQGGSIWNIQYTYFSSSPVHGDLTMDLPKLPVIKYWPPEVTEDDPPDDDLPDGGDIPWITDTPLDDIKQIVLPGFNHVPGGPPGVRSLPYRLLSVDGTPFSVYGENFEVR